MKREKLRVYVVEDYAPVSSLLDEMIETAGATVVGHADSAPAALSDIAVLHPDAVVIDIALRKGSGFDVLEAMAVNEELECALPIVLTNHTADVYRETALQLGAKYFFDKANEIDRAVEVLSRPDAARVGRRAA